MSLDSATFFLHAAPSEKTTVYVHAGPNADHDEEEEDGSQGRRCDALLIAQTYDQKLFVTLEEPRRYLTHTQLDEHSKDVEIDFLRDYEEVEEIMEEAGLAGMYNGAEGIVYHNLLFLVMNR
ncbi:hypothetical protein PK28_11505 [Hymenobacter sp. DG25B]|jgi:hypothetical protein|uniref:hypothetical protein n=1 Tax=Hymenobacter sp. DG25B TaxID=1385664 RepID=UPI000540AD94|nr:hypothetical protein [Hymenobacter sp. DG25B]AIZ64159.1 hypothetical protein PK28_11505 [Hymenobacter sp. DG25B]